MKKKKEKETKKSNKKDVKKEKGSKLFNLGEGKKSSKKGKEMSRWELAREARKVKMHDIEELSGHDRHVLEKRTEKRYKKYLDKTQKILTFFVLLYSAIAIYSIAYGSSVAIATGVMTGLFVVTYYFKAYRKGLRFWLITDTALLIADFIVVFVIGYVLKYVGITGLSDSISYLPEIVSEIKANIGIQFVYYNVVVCIFAIALGLLLRLIESPEKFIMKQEYVKMQNGD